MFGDLMFADTEIGSIGLFFVTHWTDRGKVPVIWIEKDKIVNP